MELRQLEYFAEVCRVRNFTKASENLHVAQPAVTKSIQRLEEELGTQLIDRTVKPLRLTERGERFYRRVEDILRRLEDAAAEAAEQVNSHRPLSVCVSPMSGILVDEMLREDDVVDQGFFYNIVTRSSIETLDRLMRRELDLGIVMEVDIPPELEFIPLEEQQALCLMPPDDPLTELEVLTFADLRDARFLGDMDGGKTALCRLVNQRCREAGFTANCFFSKQSYHPDMQIATALIRRGYGISFMPEHAARRMQGVVCRPVSPPLRFRLGIAYRKDRTYPVQLLKMVEYIRRKYPEYVKSVQNGLGINIQTVHNHKPME